MSCSSTHKHGIDCVSSGVSTVQLFSVRDPSLGSFSSLTQEAPYRHVRVGEEILRFTIKNFRSCWVERIESSVVNAHGSKWSLEVKPWRKSVIFDAIYFNLKNHQHMHPLLGDSSIMCKNTKFEISLQNPSYWFLNRDVLFQNCLEADGSLVIEIKFRKSLGQQLVWYPKEIPKQDILEAIYQDASSETADAVFSVGKALFGVHKAVLSAQSKKLYEISKQCNDSKPIPIVSVREEVFKSILDFIYHVKTPVVNDKVTAKELLVGADCYECLHLKLYMESVIVDKYLTIENATELLVFADSHSCALLKEAAMTLLLTDTETGASGDRWLHIKESKRLLLELPKFAIYSKNLDNYSDEIDKWDVTNIRDELAKENLELDGSREILVDRLLTHWRNQEKKRKRSS